MKIAILSYSWLRPEHLERLRKLGEVTEYKNTPTEDVAIERLKGVEVAVGDQWDTPFSEKLFENAPDLKYLALNSTGFDKTDVTAARLHGTHVANVPGFSTDAVAEHTLAIVFALLRHVVAGNAAMRAKPFQIDPVNPDHDKYSSWNLRGKTWGVIGLGQIGMRVAELAHGLGMNVVGFNRTPKNITGVQNVSLEELLTKSDVVSIHAAYSPDLKDLIGESSLQLMKPHAILVNTARGELVNEQAVATALAEKKLGGFGSDVLADYSSANPLLESENVVLTPHSAFFTKEALDNVAEILVSNVESYAEGKSKNVVNP